MNKEDLKEILAIGGIVIGIFVGAVILIVGVVSIPAYYSSCREAQVFNQKYQTTYSCGDFFWAGNQINQQIQTIKVEGLK